MTTATEEVRAYLAEIGRKGGRAKVPKGFATLSDDQKSQNAKKAIAARWGRKNKARTKASR
jgi:hypothetical protein